MSDKDHEEETVEDADDEQKEEDVEEEEEESDEDSETDDEDEDEDDESDEEDNKPVTAKDLKTIVGKTVHDILAANRRHSQKRHKQGKDYQPGRKSAGTDPSVSARLDRVESVERKRQFGYEHSLSPQEVDMVFKFDRKPSAKTLKNPFVQGGLEKLRAKQNADENTPSGHAAKVFGSEGKPWDKLDDSEKQANFATRQKAILASKGKR